MPSPTIARLNVEVKFLDADFRTYPCPRCGTDSPRHDGDVRHAIDLGIDHPIVLQIKVGVYRCPRCRKKPSFRTPLDFLDKHCIYVKRCRQKLVESIDLDKLPICLAVKRLDRDFHVAPARSTGWRWYREAAPDDAVVAEYQHLVAASFSGVISVDEVYDGQYAILCARDPITGRTLAYELSESMNQERVIAFFQKLAAIGIQPEVAVTDGSNLYPKALQAVWGAVRHQLCRFHWTKEIVSEVAKGVREYRKTLPRSEKRRKRGRPTTDEAPARGQAKSEQAARDEIRKGRFLFGARRENLDEVQKKRLAGLVARHPELGIMRAFMDDFYGIFDGKPRPSTAKDRRRHLIAKAEYAASPYLAGALKVLKDEKKFDKVALYLRYKNLNSTSDDVERDNRGFRKRQKTHYRFRSRASLEALLRRRLLEAGAPATAERLRRRFGNPNWVKNKLNKVTKKAA